METFCSDCFCFRGRDDEMTSGSRPQMWASIHWRNKSETPRQVFRSHAMQTLVCQSAQFVTDPLGKPQPVQIFLHNFSYARIARQLHNEASICRPPQLFLFLEELSNIIYSCSLTLTVVQNLVWSNQLNVSHFVIQCQLLPLHSPQIPCRPSKCVPSERLRLVKRFISHKLHTGAWGNLVLLTYLLTYSNEDQRTVSNQALCECSRPSRTSYLSFFNYLIYYYFNLLMDQLLMDLII